MTVTEPPATGVTLPTLLLMEALVALALVQVSVDELSTPMVVGLAEKVPVGVGTTVTVTCFVIVPPSPSQASACRSLLQKARH